MATGQRGHMHARAGKLGNLRRLLVAATVIAAVLGTASFTGAAPGTDASVGSYSQCANGAPPSTSTGCPEDWIHGILQASNSHYAEDDVTPQRAVLDVPEGGPTTGRTVEISYLTRKGGVHAYDSLATWNHTQTTADRCADLLPSNCVPGSGSTFPIPNDPTVVADANGSGSATSGHQLSGQVITMYGGTITGVSVPTHDDPAGDSDSYAHVTVTYTVPSLAADAKVMLLFGGHIAPGFGPRGWGAGVGAGSISGGPYHVRITAADGASVGQRDNQIMSSAILAPPNVQVVKTPDNGTINAGQPATFSVTVTNIGTTPSNVTLTDNLPVGSGGLNWSEASDPSNSCTVSALPAQPQVLGCNFGSLAAGASRTVSVTTPTDFTDCGTLNNTVTIAASGDTTPANNTDTGSITVQCPPPATITVLKTADPTSLPEPGGPVDFTVQITNDSAVRTVTISSLTDTDFGNLNGQGTCDVTPPVVITPLGSYSCTFEGSVTGNAGFVHNNVATASGTDESGNPVSDSDDATVTITDVAPTLVVTKGATPSSLPEPGGEFTFNVTVENTSGESVTIASLNDDVYGTLTGDADCQVGTVLAAGASCSFSFVGTFTGNAGDSETDTVTVCVEDNDESGICDDDPATVTITDVAPTLVVTKGATPSSLPEPGGEFTFNVTVENTSGESVTIASLNDDVYGTLTGDADCQVGTVLAAGASCSFSFVGTFTGNAGDSETDTVTVCVEDNDESGICDDDPATVTITDVAPTLVVTKGATPSSLPEPGGEFTFNVTVENTSGESVTIASLNDDVYGTLTGDADCQVGTVLAAGASCSFSFVGTFTGNAGDSETDTVTVCVEDNDESGICDDDPATVTITDVAPTLVVTKGATPSSLPEPGGEFTFNVTVQNTSGEAVTITSLNDDVYGTLTGDADCQVGTVLAAGASCSFSFVGTFTGNAGDSETDTVTVCVEDNDEGGICDDDPATVTITPNPGTLIVRKVVINDNGGAKTADAFSFQVNGGAAQPFPNDGGDPLQSQAELTVPGDQSYTVTEPAVTGYDTTYDNCSQVQIAFGGSATCTITNNDIPRGVLNVIKTANPTSVKEPGGPVNFTVTIENTGPVNVTINSVVDDKFGNLANVAGGSPSGCFAVPFVLTPGQSSTCTFPKNVSRGRPGRRT